MIRIRFVSGRWPKKYTAFVYKDERLIKTSSFGDQRYQQYKDRTPLQLYKVGDHLDERRRALYHKRHNYKAKKYSPGWFSKWYLW